MTHATLLINGVWFYQYSNSEPWKGIDNIRDDPPRFKVVLSKGDMRLYEIKEAT